MHGPHHARDELEVALRVRGVPPSGMNRIEHCSLLKEANIESIIIAVSLGDPQKAVEETDIALRSVASDQHTQIAHAVKFNCLLEAGIDPCRRPPEAVSVCVYIRIRLQLQLEAVKFKLLMYASS